jgi:hypothetical protein
MKNPFTDHPHTVNETFVEHFFVATGVGSKMIIGGIACFLHGFFPFAFKTTGSRTIRSLYERMSHGARQKTMLSSEQNLHENLQQNFQQKSHPIGAFDAALEYSI